MNQSIVCRKRKSSNTHFYDVRNGEQGDMVLYIELRDVIVGPKDSVSNDAVAGDRSSAVAGKSTVIVGTVLINPKQDPIILQLK